MSSVGITTPAPLPLRVGAKTSTCDCPQSRKNQHSSEVQPSREEDTRFALTWTDQAQPHSQTPKAPPDPRLRF